MASIKRRRDSQFYVACFTLPNGERKQVSTHTADANEALMKANAYEQASRMARKQRLDETTARRVLQQIALAAGQPGTGGLTVRHYLEEQIALLAHQYKGRTLERYRYALEHFRDHGGLDLQPLHAVRPALAVAWREALQREGLSKATINHQLGTLRRAFAPALSREWLDRNPWEGLALAGVRKGRVRRQALGFEQLQALVTAVRASELPAREEWHDLILTAAYSGQRRNDCLRLEAAQVDLKRNVLRFWRGKSKDWHEMPLHKTLRPVLAARLRTHTGRLFPTLAALPATGRRSVSDVFRQRVLPLIGIVQPYGKAAAGRQIAPLSFHSLRHGLSTWLNTAGVSDVDRAQLVGHADAEVSRGYTHAGLQEARRALAKVPKVKLRERLTNDRRAL